MEEKVLHETQPASSPLPCPTVPETMPTKMHPLPSSGLPGSTPAWVIVLLLFVFPPLAWYFMWKEAKYHAWFPVLLLLNGAVSLALAGIIIFFIYPQLAGLYQSLEIKQPSSWTTYLMYAALVFSFLQIILGILLYRKIKQSPVFPKSFLVVTIIFLILYYLLGPLYSVLTQLTVITPIYKLTSAINSTSDSEQVFQSEIEMEKSPTITPTPADKKFTNDTDEWKELKLERLQFLYPPGWTVYTNGYTELAPAGMNKQNAPITIAGEISYFPAQPDDETAITLEEMTIDGMNAGVEKKRSLYSSANYPATTELTTIQLRGWLGTWSFILHDQNYEDIFYKFLDSVKLTMKKPYDSRENVFAIQDFYVGQNISNIRLTKIEPYNPSHKLLSINAKLQFQGQASISGQYYYYGAKPDGKICFSRLSNQSEDLMPKIKGDGKSIWLCLTNTKDAKTFLSPPGKSGTATIIIDDFAINRVPHEIADTARFVSLVKLNPTLTLSPSSSTPTTSSRIANADDLKRRSDVNAILNAIAQYKADNKGVFPPGLTRMQQEVSSTRANLCSSLLPTYLAGLPIDPSIGRGPITNCSGSYNTGYEAYIDSANKVNVIAPHADSDPAIRVAR